MEAWNLEANVRLSTAVSSSHNGLWFSLFHCHRVKVNHWEREFWYSVVNVFQQSLFLSFFLFWRWIWWIGANRIAGDKPIRARKDSTTCFSLPLLPLESAFACSSTGTKCKTHCANEAGSTLERKEYFSVKHIFWNFLSIASGCTTSQRGLGIRGASRGKISRLLGHHMWWPLENEGSECCLQVTGLWVSGHGSNKCVLRKRHGKGNVWFAVLSQRLYFFFLPCSINQQQYLLADRTDLLIGCTQVY